MKRWDREVAALMRLDAALVREGKERSRALESKFYGHGGDPANHIEFESELRRREAVRKAKREQRKGKTG